MNLNKKPWEEPVQPDSLEKQFSKEIHQSHYLHKFKDCMRAIARRIDNDDVIYEIREMGFVLVHLTWSKQNSNKYPSYQMLPQEKNVQKLVDTDHKEHITY